MYFTTKANLQVTTSTYAMASCINNLYSLQENPHQKPAYVGHNNWLGKKEVDWVHPQNLIKIWMPLSGT